MNLGLAIGVSLLIGVQNITASDKTEDKQTGPVISIETVLTEMSSVSRADQTGADSGDIKVLSAPKVTVSPGAPAVIKVVQTTGLEKDDPYGTEVGIQVFVTALLDDQGISLQGRVSLSEEADRNQSPDANPLWIKLKSTDILFSAKHIAENQEIVFYVEMADKPVKIALKANVIRN